MKWLKEMSLYFPLALPSFLSSSVCSLRKRDANEWNSLTADMSVRSVLMRGGYPPSYCLGLIPHEMKNVSWKGRHFAQTDINLQFFCPPSLRVFKCIMLTLFSGRIIFHFLIILFFLLSLQY